MSYWIEPTCIAQAMKYDTWKQVMCDEFNACMKIGTCTLVAPRKHYNVIGNKWGFRLKHNIDDTIANYKARLVAKGFHQHSSIDIKDTFSLIIKPQTINLFCWSNQCQQCLSSRLFESRYTQRFPSSIWIHKFVK
jgi:hypothetical protein